MTLPRKLVSESTREKRFRCPAVLPAEAWTMKKWINWFLYERQITDGEAWLWKIGLFTVLPCLLFFWVGRWTA